jgi:5'-nucleotidase
MQRYSILIDQDGVIADYTAELFARWQTRHPAEYAQWAVPLFQVPHNTASYYDDKNPVVAKHIREIENDPGFFASLQPIPGALDAAQTLIERGHHVCICTRPAKRVMEICALEKLQWVARHLGEAWLERIMTVRDKTFADGDVLVDDKPCITGERTPSWQHVIYDQPYNRHMPGPRISWSDPEWYEKLMQYCAEAVENRRQRLLEEAMQADKKTFASFFRDRYEHDTSLQH